MSNNRPSWRLLITAVLAAAVWAGWSPPAAASPIDLGLAANYAVLGVGGTSPTNTSLFSVYQSGTVITGDVGMGPYSTWGHAIDATINGAVYYDTTDSAPIYAGGTPVQTDMTQAVAAATDATTAAMALTPTQSILASDLTGMSSPTITGGSGLNVIALTADADFKTTLAITGPADAQFVIQVVGTDKEGNLGLTLSGLQMTLSGGVTADNIVWVLPGSGGDLSITSGGALVYGTFLAPYRSIIVDNANVVGQVIGGGNTIIGTDKNGNPIYSANSLAIHSTSSVTYSPPDPPQFPDQASTLMLLGSGLMAVAGYRRWLRLK